MVVMVVMVVVGTQEARGMVVMKVMVMANFLFLHIRTAASRRRAHSPAQLLSRASPVTSSLTLSLRALNLLLKAERPRQVEGMYWGHFSHLVREDGPEMCDVAGGEA